MSLLRMAWADYKAAVTARGLSIQIVENNSSFYKLYSYDGPMAIECSILKSNTTDVSDFEDNYSSVTGVETKAKVRTQFEDENIVLKTAKLSGTADAQGDCTMEIIVPGDFSNIERYAAGGEIYTDNYSFYDFVKSIAIVDYLGIVAPEGTVLQSYTDGDVAEGNRGWYFSKYRGNEGVCEFEPLGYYGMIRGQLKLRVEIKTQANANVKGNLWWGIKDG